MALEFAAAKKDSPKGENGPQEPRTLKDLEKIISADYLKMISGASGGFSLALDPSLPPERVGYTNMRTKRIFINPLHLQMLSEPSIRGFNLHEAGHHAPEVVELQDKFSEHMQHDLTIPPAFNQTPQMREKFLGALHAHLHNALADVWLESFMGRGTFAAARSDIASLYTEGGKRESLRQYPKPEQLAQLLVGEARFPSDVPLEKLVDADVLESYKKITTSGAMRSLESTQAFVNPFSTEADRHGAIGRKFNAYSQVFLPEYLRLLEKEAQKRIEEKKKQQGKGEGEGDGEDGEPEKGEGKGKQGAGGGQPGSAGDMAQHRDVLEELLDELTQAGKEYQSLTPSEEDEGKEKAIREAIRQIAKELEEGKGQGKPKEGREGPKGLDAISDLMGQAESDRRDSQMRGLAESLGVNERAVRRWTEIKQEFRNQIESTAAALADVFLENRRMRIEFLKREGDIVPGLEFETVSAMISGEHDPETKMSSVRDPEFLETEIEGLVDQSGSMSGRKIEMSVNLFVILMEAMKRVRETLEGENLLFGDEQPLRVGVTGYDVKPMRITKLDDPLDDKKEIKIVEELSKTYGGTSETETITNIYGELKLRSRNVLKIVMLLSDGHGDGAAVHPIMEQIEKDNEVVFLAVGLGETDDEANAVVRSYLEPIKDREANVFAIAETDVDKVLPQIIDFLKREVEKRRGMFQN
jgi:hypothetical protein